MLESNAKAGPFSHVGVQTKMEEGAEIGNFVETKRSNIGANSKAKHLAYIGDARIGKGVNIGAGTIFCNYDGVKKHITKIDDDAREMQLELEINIDAKRAAGQPPMTLPLAVVMDA